MRAPNVLFLCAALLSGCGAEPETRDDNGIQVVGEDAKAPSGPAPEEAKGQPFVSNMLGSFDFALASARHLGERGELANARTFAQGFSADVTRARDELLAIAGAEKLKPEPAPGPAYQSDLALLSSTRGEPLAKAFAAQQIDALTLLVGTMRAYKNGGDNPRLRAWAEKYQGPINERLLDVQSLQAELEGND